MTDLPEHLESLSDDAKSVAAAWFAGMRPGSDSELKLRMRESRPTKRTQAALDELVAAGIVSCMPLDGGGLSYRPLLPCNMLLKWAFDRMNDNVGAFTLVEPIDAGSPPSGSATMSVRVSR